MRRATMWAAAMAALLTAVATGTTAALAQEWCGYSPRDKSTIECGYTSLTACESALGQAGLCFADPEYALNAHGKAPVTTAQSTAKKTQPLAASFER